MWGGWVGGGLRDNVKSRHVLGLPKFAQAFRGRGAAHGGGFPGAESALCTIKSKSDLRALEVINQLRFMSAVLRKSACRSRSPSDEMTPQSIKMGRARSGRPSAASVPSVISSTDKQRRDGDRRLRQTAASDALRSEPPTSTPPPSEERAQAGKKKLRKAREIAGTPCEDAARSQARVSK